MKLKSFEQYIDIGQQQDIAAWVLHWEIGKVP